MTSTTYDKPSFQDFDNWLIDNGYSVEKHQDNFELWQEYIAIPSTFNADFSCTAISKGKIEYQHDNRTNEYLSISDFDERDFEQD